LRRVLDIVYSKIRLTVTFTNENSVKNSTTIIMEK
jgi:hypothetical protein